MPQADAVPTDGRVGDRAGTLGQRRTIRAPLGLEGEADVKARVHQPGLDAIHRAAGPAVSFLEPLERYWTKNVGIIKKLPKGLTKED